MWTEIAAVAILAAAAFLYFSNRSQKPARTAQDLFDFKVSEDGIIELPGRRFRLILEVRPINIDLKSSDEQAAVWLGFRNMLNSLTLPVTFLVQSRFLDIKDYLADLKNLAEKAPTPELGSYGLRLCEWLEKLAEGKRIRDRRYYIILKIDASDLESYDAGIRFESEFANALLSSLARRKSLSDEDARELARAELENMAGVVINSLISLEIETARLDRKAVLELIYSTFNRDMATVVRFADADRLGMFSLVPESLTSVLEGEVPGVLEEKEIA